MPASGARRLIWDRASVDCSFSNTHIHTSGAPRMNRRGILVAIVGVLAAVTIGLVLYLLLTWHGRALTILGAVTIIATTPLDTTVGGAMVQATSSALNCSA